MTDTLKLKALMLLQGFTQEDLAKHLGLSKQTINMKLNNKRSFKLSEIAKICELLKIDNAQERFLIFFADKVDLRLQNA